MLQNGRGEEAILAAKYDEFHRDYTYKTRYMLDFLMLKNKRKTFGRFFNSKK